MLEIVFIPFLTLGSTIAIYYILGPSLKRYQESAEKKFDKMQRIWVLVVASEFVSFFSKSETSRMVEKLLESEREDDNSLVKSLDESIVIARYEMEKFFTRQKKEYERLSYMSKMRVSAFYIRIFVLVFGVIIASAQLLLFYLLFSTAFYLTSFLNGLFLGGSIIFSGILATMIIYMWNVSRKLDLEYTSIMGEQHAEGV